MGIRIVTDSSCDLPEEMLARYSIAVVPLYINIGTESYLDGVEMSRAQFYEGLPRFASHPTTSVPGTESFVRPYERLVDEGATGIVSIHIASSLSAVVNVARMAAREVARVPVTVVDSGQLTLGVGLLVEAAARAAEEGRTLDEIVALVEEQAARTHCFAALDTLEFLRRSGRLTRFQSSLGSMLQVKPILKMHRGEMGMERVRTRNGASARLVSLVRGLGALEQLALVHTQAPDKADVLYRSARSLFPGDRAPVRAEVTPVIGAHIGPRAAGFVAIQARGGGGQGGDGA